MLAAERHSHILEELTQRGVVRIAKLATTFDVSEMTIRRDLEQLADAGLLNKVHGGATVKLETTAVTEPPFGAKSLREQALKVSIARRASKLVEPGSSVALMGGSTVFALARELTNVPRLTVVTNSLPVSDLFHREGRADQTVILTGGLRTPTDSLVGEMAVTVFDRLNVDLTFMGAHGMDQRGGFSSPNILEVETNRAIRARTKRLVIMADHTKWGEVAFGTFAELGEADVLISDTGLTPEAIATLKTQISDVQLVGTTE